MTSIKILWRISYILAFMLVAAQFIIFAASAISSASRDTVDESSFFPGIFLWMAAVVNAHVPKLLIVSFTGWVVAYVLRSWKRED